MSSKVKRNAEAALKLFQKKFPARQPSVAAIAKQAGVSRSNLYKAHPALVEKILNRPIGEPTLAPRKDSQPKVAADAKWVDQIEALERKVQTLSYMCIELESANRRAAGNKRVAKKPPAVNDVLSALARMAKLSSRSGVFVRMTALSYLIGTPTDLSGFDSLDEPNQECLLTFLRLAGVKAIPVEALDYLQAELMSY